MPIVVAHQPPATLIGPYAYGAAKRLTEEQLRRQEELLRRQEAARRMQAGLRLLLERMREGAAWARQTRALQTQVAIQDLIRQRQHELERLRHLYTLQQMETKRRWQREDIQRAQEIARQQQEIARQQAEKAQEEGIVDNTLKDVRRFYNSFPPSTRAKLAHLWARALAIYNNDQLAPREKIVALRKLVDQIAEQAATQPSPTTDDIANRLENYDRIARYLAEGIPPKDWEKHLKNLGVPDDAISFIGRKAQYYLQQQKQRQQKQAQSLPWEGKTADVKTAYALGFLALAIEAASRSLEIAKTFMRYGVGIYGADARIAENLERRILGILMQNEGWEQDDERLKKAAVRLRNWLGMAYSLRAGDEIDEALGKAIYQAGAPYRVEAEESVRDLLPVPTKETAPPTPPERHPAPTTRPTPTTRPASAPSPIDQARQSEEVLREVLQEMNLSGKERERTITVVNYLLSGGRVALSPEECERVLLFLNKYLKRIGRLEDINAIAGRITVSQ